MKGEIDENTPPSIELVFVSLTFKNSNLTYQKYWGEGHCLLCILFTDNLLETLTCL